MAENVKAECCAVPDVVVDGYVPKGIYRPYGGLDKAYIVTPEGDHKYGVVFVFDVFGFWPSTIQAADLLSRKFNATVVIPDFFRGKPLPIDFTKMEEEARLKLRADFFTHLGNFDDRLPEVQAAAKQLKDEGKTFVGAVGLCWGGRLVLNAGEQEGGSVDAVAACHPAMLKESDGAEILVPFGLYPSKTDQIDVAEAIFNGAKSKPFSAKNDFKPYPNMHHGWAGAHAHLDDPENVKEFADVYERISKLFTNAAQA